MKNELNMIKTQNNKHDECMHSRNTTNKRHETHKSNAQQKHNKQATNAITRGLNTTTHESTANIHNILNTINKNIKRQMKAQCKHKQHKTQHNNNNDT